MNNDFWKNVNKIPIKNYLIDHKYYEVLRETISNCQSVTNIKERTEIGLKLIFFL